MDEFIVYKIKCYECGKEFGVVLPVDCDDEVEMCVLCGADSLSVNEVDDDGDEQ